MDALVQAVLDWLSHHFNQEYAVITAAPVAFSVCVLLASTAIYFALRVYFRHELSSRDSTIKIHEERHKLKDDRLARFLSNTEDSASPEAKDQIATLRAELDQIKSGIVSKKAPAAQPSKLASDVSFGDTEGRFLIFRDGAFYLASQADKRTHFGVVLPFTNVPGYWWNQKVRRADVVTAYIVFRAEKTKREKTTHREAEEVFRIHRSAWLGTQEDFVALSPGERQFLILAVCHVGAPQSWYGIELLSRGIVSPSGNRVELKPITNPRIKMLCVEPIVDGVNIARSLHLPLSLFPQMPSDVSREKI